jgi:trehalose 6-phosphate phosphatase
VACVTGRRASEARALVSIGTITYLGSHGAELLRAGWTESVLDPSLEDWVRRMHEFGREADTADVRRRRIRVEDKGPILAFHWRGAPDEDAARAAIDAIAAKAEAAGLRTHWGRKVLEVRPPVRIDKGAGITAFLDGVDVDRALYVGDDATDLDAFQALSKLVEDGRLQQAIRVGVRSDEGPSEITSDADLVVEGTEGVLELLALLASD